MACKRSRVRISLAPPIPTCCMFVYVIQSTLDGSHYVGMSADPERRLLDHNRGKVTSTKCKIPWFIVYTEESRDRIEARKREKYLKSAAGRKFRKGLF